MEQGSAPSSTSSSCSRLLQPTSRLLPNTAASAPSDDATHFPLSSVLAHGFRSVKGVERQSVAARSFPLQHRSRIGHSQTPIVQPGSLHHASTPATARDSVRPYLGQLPLPSPSPTSHCSFSCPRPASFRQHSIPKISVEPESRARVAQA